MEPGSGGRARTARRRAVVVIPTYDERGNICRALDAVLATGAADVVVVDDNSPDGTARLVEQHRSYGRSVHLLERPGKAGLGAAYRAGFGWALAHGYEQVVQMDADLSHPPDRIRALLDALDDHDVAVGSRYVPGGGVRDWSPLRRLVSWAGNAYVRAVLRLPVRDATAGFKAFRAEALVTLGAVETSSNGYCFQVENTWRAVRSGMRVVEVPITFTDRTSGRSKMSPGIVLEAVLRVLTWRAAEISERYVDHHRAAA